VRYRRGRDGKASDQQSSRTRGDDGIRMKEVKERGKICVTHPEL
jgi:hypothetical protein